jgi:hypothetical protein
LSCAKFHRVQGFRERADLIDLDQNGIGHAFVNSLLEEFDVGHKHIVADQLNLVAQFLRQEFPGFPIVFRAAVLQADDGILPGQFDVKRHQVFAFQFLPRAFLENVLPEAAS